MKQTIEAFLKGAIGTILSLIPAKYFFDSIPLIVIIAGLGGILGEIVLPHLLYRKNDKTNDNIKPSNRIKKLGITFIISTITFFLCFQIYMTYDKYDYGQQLKIVSFTNVRMHEKPLFNDNSNRTILVLKAGEKVTYISKQPRRLGRRTDLKYYLDFWREVETKNGKKGWVYGAYLE